MRQAPPCYNGGPDGQRGTWGQGMKAPDDREKHLRRMRKWLKWVRPRRFLLVWGVSTALSVAITIGTQVVGHWGRAGHLVDPLGWFYRLPWLAFVIGAAFGLFWVVPWKWFLRRHGRWWAEAVLRRRISGWHRFLVGSGLALCFWLCFWAALGAAFFLNIALLPGLLAIWVPGFLLYPDEKEYYEAAEKAVEELERELASEQSEVRER